jgi:hypothetical protein
MAMRNGDTNAEASSGGVRPRTTSNTPAESVLVYMAALTSRAARPSEFSDILKVLLSLQGL